MVNGLSSPLKIALVGCGAISQIHYAPALRALANGGVVDVVELIDPSPSSLAAVAAHFPSAALSGGLPEASPSFEAAIVASPVSLHARQAVALLNRGIHVLCEKPMAATLAECESMVVAAAAARRVLAVGLFRRFFSGTSQMRELVKAQSLGAVRSFEIVEGNRFQWRAKTDSFFRKSAGGGGVLLDIGVHVLDLMLWWFGDPEKVLCEDDSMGGVEANCRIHCRFPGGLEGSVRLSREWNLDNRYLVRFERGWAAWNPANPGSIELGLEGRHAMSAQVHATVERLGRPRLGPEGSTYYESFIAQIENFAGAARGRTQLLVSGEEGLRSITLIENCYRTSRLMRMPWMSEAEVLAAEGARC